MLTIFTSPKPFRGHIGVIQLNAVRSWISIDPAVEVLLIGDEEGMREAATELRLRHIPDVERNPQGTPLLNSVFSKAREAARHPVLCYVNADVMVLQDMLPALRQVQARFPEYLIIGQRWDLEVRDPLALREGWEQGLRTELRSRGRLHPPAGSDFFIFPRSLFSEMPAFALGRAGWDNWMIYAGRAAKIPVVDATAMITAIHQDHDYAHLPGGQPHYHLPESRENVELAGGREMIFRLTDADWRITPIGLEKKSWRDFGFWRWVEVELILASGPGRRARIVRMAFHPLDTMGYFLRRSIERLRRLMASVFKRGSEGPSGDR